jgi:ribose 5-phosphate isomerase B
MSNEIKPVGKIAIASDHAGYQLKETVRQFVLALGYEVNDFGANSDVSVDYPVFAFQAAEAVSLGRSDRGILICGTGLGMCIAANKVKGIRAVNAYDKFTAEMSRRHNDANVLCLGARSLGGQADIKELVKIWLETPFESGNNRHQRRLAQISDYESD